MIEAIRQHLKIKIVVIGLAIFIWFFVKTENNYKFAFEIPIVPTNLPGNKIIINKLPEKARVTFWGKGRDLVTFKINRRLYYNLDLLNIDDDKVFIPDIHNIRLPHESTIEVLNILEPDSIFVKVADIKQKLVPMSPQISVQTIPGYTIVDGIQLTMDSVLVFGPQSQLDSIQEIKTRPLTYRKARRNIYDTVELITPDLRYVSIPTRTVSFFVNIQKLMEKRISEVPVSVINVPPNYEIIVIPSSLNLTVIGGVNVLLPLTNSDIKAYIDYNKVKGSRSKEHLAYIEKIDGVRFKDIKPKKFKILIKKVR